MPFYLIHPIQSPEYQCFQGFCLSKMWIRCPVRIPAFLVSGPGVGVLCIGTKQKRSTRPLDFVEILDAYWQSQPLQPLLHRSFCNLLQRIWVGLRRNFPRFHNKHGQFPNFPYLPPSFAFSFQLQWKSPVGDLRTPATCNFRFCGWRAKLPLSPNV